jgi:hypothetical protein
VIRATAARVPATVNHDDCARLAALAPSVALGALDCDESAFVQRHLASCTRPHPELRDALAVAAMIGGAAVQEAFPSAALRQRVLGAALRSPSRSPGRGPVAVPLPGLDRRAH